MPAEPGTWAPNPEWTHLSDDGPRPEDTAKGQEMQEAHDPAMLLGEIEDLIRAYVALTTEEQYAAVALWVAHTYTWREAAYTTPYLSIQAPEKQSGKSRLLEVLEQSAHNALKAASISPAAVYRAVEKWKPTLLIDEADTIFEGKGEDHAALRGIIDDGYRRGGRALRVDAKSGEVLSFSTFCPKAIAGIGSPPETIVDRSIVIQMKRKRRDERVLPFRQTAARLADAKSFRLRLEAGFGAIADQLKAAEPEMPEALSDRQADCWEPLIAIADSAGNGWPDRARRAAVLLSMGAGDATEESFRMRLLAETRKVFGDEDRMPTVRLLAGLNLMDEAPWATFGLDPRSLAKNLRPYGIGSRDIRIGEQVAKGYLRSDFEDAWARYLQPM